MTTFSKRNPVHAAAALASLICATAAGTALAAEPMDPGVAFAMQRDLGIMPGQIAQFMKDESQARVDERAVRLALGEDFSGAWTKALPGGRARLVVSTTLSPGAARRRLPADMRTRVDIMTARHPLSRLERGHKALNDASMQMDKRRLRGLSAWWVDEKTNRLVISVAPGSDMSAAIDFAAASGVDADLIDIRTGIGMARPEASSPILGGSNYDANGKPNCSFGFSARRAKSSGGYDEYILTAGHCHANGVAISKNGIRIGTVYGRSYPGNDYAVIKIENTADWYTTEYVKDNSSDGRLFISGTSVQSNGGSICRSGWSTGWRCGNITAKNVTINQGTVEDPILVFGTTGTDSCSGPGDSGGSHLSQINSQWHAQGVHSAGVGTPEGGKNSCNTPKDKRAAYFQPVSEILTATNTYIVRR